MNEKRPELVRLGKMFTALLILCPLALLGLWKLGEIIFWLASKMFWPEGVI